MKVQEVMTSNPACCAPDATTRSGASWSSMAGGCCGIVAQADLARKGSEQMASELVRDVSQPSGGGSGART